MLRDSSPTTLALPSVIRVMKLVSERHDRELAAPVHARLRARADSPRLVPGAHRLIDPRRDAVRRVASLHQVHGLRWWPPTAHPVWLDFVVETMPASVPAFRSALEAAVGCRVAVYLADEIPPEAWGRMLWRKR